MLAVALLCAAAIPTAALAGDRGVDRVALFDAPGGAGVGQVQGVHNAIKQRLARVRSLATAPKVEDSDFGAPNRRQVAGQTLPGLVAGAGDVPLYSGGFRDMGVWATGFGQSGGQASRDGVSGYGTTVAGAFVGIDRPVGEHLVVGLGTAFAHGDFTWHANGGAGTSSGGSTALYGSYFNRSMFVDASVTSGWNQIEALPLDAGAAIDRTDIVIGAQLGAGLDFKLARFRLQPLVRLSYAAVERIGGTGGGDGFGWEEVGGERVQHVRTMTGVRLMRAFRLGGNRLEAEGRLAWTREFSLTRMAAGKAAKSTSLVGLDRDAVASRAGLSMRIGHQWDLFTHYDAEFVDQIDKHTIETGLRFSF